ncbi:hypothetical protein DBR42_15230 [Pelomonas sp. HMWF004]|nr:hypothetical protein DBR42_15230 [Pelomonas sp. HMWF004]
MKASRLWAVLALSPALLLISPLRHAVESQMSLHMLVEFPLLLAAGWAWGRWLPAKVLSALDAQGLLGATLASCVLAFWMIPAALDLALLSAPVAAAKYCSWLLAGALLAWGRQRLGAVLACFFLGNTAWMTATAGLLYREADRQLCVNYLVDDQLITGNGLVVTALVLGAQALLRLRPLFLPGNALDRDETGAG